MANFETVGEFSFEEPTELSDHLLIELNGFKSHFQENGFITFTQEEINKVCLQGVALTLRTGAYRPPATGDIYCPRGTERVGVLSKPCFMTTSAFILPETKTEQAFAGVDLKVDYAQTESELLMFRKWHHLDLGHKWRLMERIRLPEIGRSPTATFGIIEKNRNKRYKYPVEDQVI